jgi:hypothetical protein
LKGKIASIPKPQLKEFLKKGGKRKKSTPEAKKLDVVDVEALPEDVEASIVNFASLFIMKKDEPIAKWLRPSPLTQPQGVPSSSVSTFELLSSLLWSTLMDCKCLEFLIHLLKFLIRIGRFQTS